MHEEKDSLTQMPVTVFTLQSIYASSDDDKLLFQLNQGRMDMLVTVELSSGYFDSLRMLEFSFNCKILKF